MTTTSTPTPTPPPAPSTPAGKKVLPAWLHELFELALGAAGYEAIRKLITLFAERTGDKLTEHAAAWIAVRLGGIKVEDEVRFNEALPLLDRNDRIVLSKRLGEFTTPEQSDYYRITVMQDTPQKIAAIIQMHGRMSVAEWQRWKQIMNYDRHRAEATYQKFVVWCKTDAKQTLADLGQDIDEDTRRQDVILADLERRLAESELTLWQRFVNWRKIRSQRNREWAFFFQLRPFRFGFGRRNTRRPNQSPTVIITPQTANTDPRRSLGA